MAYDGKVLALARERFEADKEKHAAEFRRRREEIYGRIPRLRAIERDLRCTMASVLSLTLRRGEDIAAQIEEQKRINLALQQERAQLLAEAGYAPDALTEKPLCEACGDTGYGRDNTLCACLKKYYIAEQNRELSRLLNIGTQSFDTFRMDYYSRAVWKDYGMSPYDNMMLISGICRRYVSDFGRGGGIRNLFLTGTPGLGKTFLSACMAREISKAGFSVVYDTATHVFSQFETEKFRRGREEEQEEAAADVRRYLACDLLIVDDLGTELLTPFVQDALYQLINGRLVANKRTVINSNLTEGEIAKRYSPQIASRLSGEYRMLTFFGEDIRKIRQRNEI